MSRFEITAPVPGFRGDSAGVMFDNGKAVITSDTAQGLSALAYFRSQGYGILPLDGVHPDEVLQHGNESALEESARLDREIAELKAKRDVEAKRKERDDLYREVYGADEPAELTPGAEGEDGQHPAIVETAPVERAGPAGEGSTSAPLAPPANNASAEEWRAWVAASGRGTAEDVAEKSRTEIINTYGADYDRDREAQLKGGGVA